MYPCAGTMTGLRLIATLLLLCLFSVSVSGHRGHDGPSNGAHLYLNYGLVLRQIDTVDLISDTWFQTFVIHLPVVNRSLLQQETIDCEMLGRPDGCDNLIHLLRYMANATRKALVELDTTMRHIRTLVREVRSDDRSEDSREARGLFDFVGEMTHSLFGIARDKDVENVHRTIQHLAQRQEKMVSLWQKAEHRLASYGRTMSRRMDNIARMVDVQKTAVHDLYQDVLRQATDQRQIGTMLLLLLGKMEDFVILQGHLNVFQTGLEMLVNGFLSPSLVSPRDLFLALTEIKSRVQTFQRSDGLTLRLLRDKVVHYYRQHDFVAVRHGDTLLIQVPIPLGVIPSSLNLYEVHLISMTTPGSEPHATILAGVPNYIAYNSESPYYLEFEQKPVISATKLIHLEDVHSSLKSVEQQSCILSIMRDDKSAIHKLCDYAILTHSIKPNVFTLDRHHLLLTNISGTVFCPSNRNHTVTCVATCRITLPCGCSLVAATTIIPARLEGCWPSLTKPRVLHSVNLAFLQQFFNESQLSDLYSDTLLPNPLKVIAPQLKIFESNLSHALQIDKKNKLSLKKLANLTKNDEQGFASLADAMYPTWLDLTAGNYDNRFNFSSWKTWISIITTLLAVFGCFLAVMLSYKVKILAATVASLSLTQRVHGLPSELNYFEQNGSEQNSTAKVFLLSFPTDLTLDLSVIFLLILIFLVIVVKSVRRHKKLLYEFHLYLYVGSEGKMCQIWLRKFKLEPNYYKFVATSYLESLQIVGCLSPKLILDWPTLSISCDVTSELYTLPRICDLTWIQAWQLRQILSLSYWSVLVARTRADENLVILPKRVGDCISAPPYAEPGTSKMQSIVTLQTTASSAPILYPSLQEAETVF